MRRISILIVLFLSISLFAQENTSLKTYRATETKIHDLVHTKLKVAFDFTKSQMQGEAWITAKAHFYPIQNFTLDAKAMLIHKVSLANIPLDYNYNGKELIIDLGKVYKKGEEFTVYISYTARPEEVKQEGSSAISAAKGLYFIDPKDTDPEKPTQIWTQGETEASSCWFPTIDTPFQKTTQEIYITVPSRFTTLSNGILKSQINNEDETRTDYWQMNQPHAPYLFFMGIGEFRVIKDTWNDLAVNYYVESEYQEEAQAIFGNTPEMIQFFSDTFGVAYPWQKYSQMVARDFVSGAMENTTATLHNESAYQKKGQLVDENTWEDIISHELSHHWFGNLVTAESWSNIALNESFATYSSYLWRAYKYGKDHADAKLYEYKTSYTQADLFDKNLVRFHYESREDIFDAVSYQKGATILHMLRNFLGDEAFFLGLKNYLIKYQFKDAEVHELRIVLEEVSGKDLNPFFNQWFFGNGHPKLHISYEFDELFKSLSVTVKQAEKVFDFPLTIAVYESGIVANHQIQVNQKEQTFSFPFTKKPNLILVNANRTLLCELTDNSKTLENYIFQYKNAPHYLDRREAILEIAKNQDNEMAFNTLTKALKDSYYGLRILALEHINLTAKYNKKRTIKAIEKLATKDPKTKVRGVAIRVLGKLVDPVYKPLYKRGMQSPSYSIKGNATLAMYEIDKNLALSMIKEFDTDAKEYLASILTKIYIREEDESQMPFIANNLLDTMFSSNFSQYNKDAFEKTFHWLATSKKKEVIQSLVSDLVTKGKRYKKEGVDQMSLALLRQLIDIQTKSDNPDKKALIFIVKQGMANLIE